MRRKRFFQQITEELLPAEFKTVSDGKYEYVSFRNSQINDIDFCIEDKTMFEALDNHIHFFDNVRKSEMPYLKKIAECVCSLVLGKLEADFPEKQFIVFVVIQRKESVIFRFHQLWPDEPTYYDEDRDTADLIIISRRSKKPIG